MDGSAFNYGNTFSAKRVGGFILFMVILCIAIGAIMGGLAVHLLS